MQDYVDIKEAAERLDVSTKTIRRYIQANRLHAEKIRNVWLIASEEIERLLHEDDLMAQAAVTALPPEIMDRLAAIELKLDTLHARLGDLPAPNNAGVEQKLDGIRARLDQLPLHTAGIEQKLDALGARLEASSIPGGNELEDALSRAAQLEEETQGLRYEIEGLNREVARSRADNTPDIQSVKSRAEEIDALKSSLISNERGLALLREEVGHKDAVIKEKEQEIFQLLEKLKEMDTMRKPVQAPSTKPRFFGGFNRG